MPDREIESEYVIDISSTDFTTFQVSAVFPEQLVERCQRGENDAYQQVEARLRSNHNYKHQFDRIPAGTYLILSFTRKIRDVGC